jgi:hypothetical protein
MNKEQLSARKSEIEAEMARLVANHSVLAGHLAEVTHWITQEDAAAVAPVEAAVAEAEVVAPVEGIE